MTSSPLPEDEIRQHKQRLTKELEEEQKRPILRLQQKAQEKQRLDAEFRKKLELQHQLGIDIENARGKYAPMIGRIQVWFGNLVWGDSYAISTYIYCEKREERIFDKGNSKNGYFISWEGDWKHADSSLISASPVIRVGIYCITRQREITISIAGLTEKELEQKIKNKLSELYKSDDAIKYYLTGVKMDYKAIQLLEKKKADDTGMGCFLVVISLAISYMVLFFVSSTSQNDEIACVLSIITMFGLTRFSYQLINRPLVK